MRRYLYVYLPHWSSDLFRRQKTLRSKGIQSSSQQSPQQTPLLFTDSSASQPLVKRYCALCEEQGITSGMSLNLAQALAPGVRSYSFTPEADYQALKKLARWALRFSPLVMLDDEIEEAARRGLLKKISERSNGFVIDSTGTEKVHGGEKELCERLSRALVRAGLEHRIALSQSIASAWGLSHFAREPLVIVPKSKGIAGASLEHYEASTLWPYIRQLPVEALRFDDKQNQRLKEMGIYSIEGVLRLPIKKFAQRFGKLSQQRIKQFFGLQAEPFKAVRDDIPDSVYRHFDIALFKQESIQKACLTLIQKLLEQLRAKDLQPGNIHIDIYGEDLRERPFFLQKELLLNRSMASDSQLLSILRPTLEQIRFPGGITGLEVRSEIVDRLQHLQLRADRDITEQVSDELLAEFLNKVALRLGQEGMRRINMRESSLPEEAFELQEVERNYPKQLQPEKAAAEIPLQCPSTILKRPERIQTVALLPDKPPSRLRWAGQNNKVLIGLGPERVSPEWWRDKRHFSEREYFKVQIEGGMWLWIFRERSTQDWFLHGVWS